MVVDVERDADPSHRPLSGAGPQSVTESQARQTRGSPAGAEVPSCSNRDVLNLSIGVEELHVILESKIVSPGAEQSSGEMVAQEDAASQSSEGGVGRPCQLQTGRYCLCTGKTMEKQ